MFATGFVVLERDPVVSRLVERARELLETPLDPDEQRLTRARYFAALLYEDAGDVVARDPATASLILRSAVEGMLDVAFLQRHSYIPRRKDLLGRIDEVDPELGKLARGFYLTGEPDLQLQLAGQIADRTLGARGFFEWDSTPEEVGPDGSVVKSSATPVETSGAEADG